MFICFFCLSVCLIFCLFGSLSLCLSVCLLIFIIMMFVTVGMYRCVGVHVSEPFNACRLVNCRAILARKVTLDYLGKMVLRYHLFSVSVMSNE